MFVGMSFQLKEKHRFCKWSVQNIKIEVILVLRSREDKLFAVPSCLGTVAGALLGSRGVSPAMPLVGSITEMTASHAARVRYHRACLGLRGVAAAWPRPDANERTPKYEAEGSLVPNLTGQKFTNSPHWATV